MSIIYNFDFKLEISGTGETPEEAWEIARELLKEQLADTDTPDPSMPEEYTRTGAVDAVMRLTCSLCGKTEVVSEEDHGDWFPEVWLKDMHLGMACPECVGAVCSMDEETAVLEVDLKKVDFRNGYRPLIKSIEAKLEH